MGYPWPTEDDLEVPASMPRCCCVDDSCGPECLRLTYINDNSPFWSAGDLYTDLRLVTRQWAIEAMVQRCTWGDFEPPSGDFLFGNAGASTILYGSDGAGMTQQTGSAITGIYGADAETGDPGYTPGDGVYDILVSIAACARPPLSGVNEPMN